MYSTIYWITRLDGIKDALEGVAIASLVLSIFAGVFSVVFVAEDCGIDGGMRKTIKRAFKIIVFVGFFSLIANVFVPTRNEALLIIGGGKVYEYVQQDTALQKIPGATTEYIKVLLEREIDDIKNKTK